MCAEQKIATEPVNERDKGFEFLVDILRAYMTRECCAYHGALVLTYALCAAITSLNGNIKPFAEIMLEECKSVDELREQKEVPIQ